MKPIVYMFCYKCDPLGVGQRPTHDGIAVAGDGSTLAMHSSSDHAWCKLDLTSKPYVDRYEERYPDGYETKWIEADEARQKFPSFFEGQPMGSTISDADFDRFAQHTCDVLAAVLDADARALVSLIETRVPCDQALADHPTVQVSRDNRVGLMGIINGLFGLRANGLGRVAAVYDKQHVLVGFTLTKDAPAQSQELIRRHSKLGGGAHS